MHDFDLWGCRTVSAPLLPENDAWNDLLQVDGDIPEPARAALSMAVSAWGDGDKAEASIRAALTVAPDHPAVRVAAYRFYFFGNRLLEAAPLALWCVEWAAARLGAGPDWRLVSPAVADFSAMEPLPRFFLLALKAYGYVLVRLGDVSDGRAAVAKVAALDPCDKVGAVNLLTVIDRGGQDDD